MKEKIKDILAGLGLIAGGVVAFFLADEYVFNLFHVIPIDLRIVGSIIAAIGLLSIIMALVKKDPGQQAEPAPQRERRKSRKEANTPVPPPPPTEVPIFDFTAVVNSAKAENTPETYRDAMQVLEARLEIEPGNRELLAAALAMYDGYLRTRGDRSFPDYQQRFYAALRAIFMEEQNGMPSTTRRFWVIHSAVHGGIAAATAKDLDQLEDALFMLERASQFRTEGSRPVDQQYVQTAIPSVQCWVAYWIARICLTDRPDYRRSAEALKLAASLCPPEGLRGCDMNPHLQTSTKVVLTPQHLETVKKHLLAKANSQK